MFPRGFDPSVGQWHIMCLLGCHTLQLTATAYYVATHALKNTNSKSKRVWPHTGPPVGLTARALAQWCPLCEWLKIAPWNCGPHTRRFTAEKLCTFI